MDKDSKVFLAGGTGLVGSAILKNLISKGYKNIVANYHRSIPLSLRGNQNLKQGEAHTEINSIRYKRLDLLDSIKVAEFFEKEQPEIVFLAAAKVGGIFANNTYRADFIYENLAIQNNVIHQSYVQGVKKLLFLGSTCIYPKNAPQPMPENCLLSSELEYTNEPYAIAKIAGMKMCESYNLQYGTNFISVMPTNLYGPNDNFDLEESHVLPALIRKIHLGKCLENIKWGKLSAGKDKSWEMLKSDLDKNPIEGITGNSTKEEILNILGKYGVKYSEHSMPMTEVEIWGSGKPRREFLWSEDMADACVYLIENVNFKELIKQELSTEKSVANRDGFSNEIRNTHLNIGTGIDISIKKLAELIQSIIGFDGGLCFNAHKPDGTMVKLTNPSKLHSLGWKHSVDLKDGIQRMYECYLGKGEE